MGLRLSCVMVIACALTVARTACADVTIHGPETAAREILATDRAFSDRSAAVGTAQAFRQFMDGTDGLEFAGGEPKRGAKAIYDAHGGDAPAKAVLTWIPAEVFVSASGDLGVTWGRWVDKPIDPAGKNLTGRYVTVWRKDAAGAWKGIIDIGDAD